MVDKNFKQEACQLHIEQQIEEQLAKGLTPHKVAKEVAVWLKDILGVEVKVNTIRMRAERYIQELCTNVQKTDNQNKIVELYNKRQAKKNLPTSVAKVDDQNNELPIIVAKSKLVKMTPELRKILEQISIKELQDVVSKAAIISKEVGADQSVFTTLDLGLHMYHNQKETEQR